ncbi:MAG: hypothetical protein ABI468_02800 [Candidatus Nanopelagicales bacterium]
MGEDGRLGDAELDEVLGPVRHTRRSTACPDDGSPDYRSPSEVLAYGDERPSLGQRAAGFTGRHRRLTAAVAISALIATAGVLTWSRSPMPPPGNTAVAARAWYRPSLPEMTSVNVSNGVVTSTLYLQVPAGVAVPTAVSLTGQGLGGGVLTQDGSDLTVTSPLDCNTIGDLAAAATATVLHVRHPDDADREVSADLPLSLNPGSAGIPVADAVAALRRACVGRLSDSLALLGVRAGATPSGEVLVLRVKNPTQHELVLLGAQTNLAPSDAWIGSPVTAPGAASQSAQVQGKSMPAGATTSITLPVVRTNCADLVTGAGVSAGLGAGAGRPTGDFALWVSPPGTQSYPRDDSWTARQLTTTQQGAVKDALGAPCRGAPQLSYAIRSVQAASPGSGTVTFQVQARATSGRLNISGEGALGGLLAVTVLPRASRSGRLDVSVQLSYGYCATGFDQMLPAPPVLSLEARVGRSTYPYLLIVGNRTVLDAFGRACGQQPDLALARSAGWDI